MILEQILSMLMTFDEPDYKIMKIAEKGYNYTKKNISKISPYMLIVDYSKPSTNKRLWLINMQTKQILINTHVAHGVNSGLDKAKNFSNKPKSKQSSIGFFLTQNHYNGKHGSSIRISGLEPVNNNALKRGIVIHSANYVSSQTLKALHRLGRSWGCFAVNPKDLAIIKNKTQQPSLILSYYPNRKWLTTSKFIS